MILPWKNYLGENNEVSFETPDGVKYIAYPNNDSHIIVKKINLDGTEIEFNPAEWNDEKMEISFKYSDIYGVFEPCDFDDLEEDDDKQCLFGKTPGGLYLDQLQRPEYVMNHDMTSMIFEKDNWGKLHTPDGGKTIWKTEWCERLGEHYNCMRCDVFPENPGWKKIDFEDVKEILKENSDLFDDVDLVISKLENYNWPLPTYQKESIIGNWLIP